MRILIIAFCLTTVSAQGQIEIKDLSFNSITFKNARKNVHEKKSFKTSYEIKQREVSSFHHHISYNYSPKNNRHDYSKLNRRKDKTLFFLSGLTGAIMGYGVYYTVKLIKALGLESYDGQAKKYMIGGAIFFMSITYSSTF